MTGASGFIGSALVRALAANSHVVTATSRSPRPESYPDEVDWLQSDPADLAEADITGHEAMIHLAAISDSRGLAEHDIFRVNQKRAEDIAGLAKRAHVDKFLLFSSVKAISEKSIVHNSVPSPTSIYGKSKLAAEISVRGLLQNSKTKLYVLRPAPVYGNPVRANFRLLNKLVDSRLPLPFGSLDARKSYLYRENLLDFLSTVLDGEIEPGDYNLADSRSLTLPELLDLISEAKDIDSKVFSIPRGFLTLGARFLPTSYSDLLFSDSIVGENPAQMSGLWQPPFSPEEGVKQSFGNSLKP